MMQQTIQTDKAGAGNTRLNDYLLDDLNTNNSNNTANLADFPATSNDGEPCQQTQAGILLSALWGDDVQNYRVVCIGQAANHNFFLSNTEALQAITELRQIHTNIWFAPALFNSNNGELKRKQENVIACRALFLDVDTGETKSYKTLAEAQTAVDSFLQITRLPEPTRVCSGNGYHLYFILDRFLAKDEWVEKARQLKQLCKMHGLKADGQITTDTARLLRVPGTLNVKNAQEPKQCKLLNEIKIYSADAVFGVLSKADVKRSQQSAREVNSIFSTEPEYIAQNEQEGQETAAFCLPYLSQARCDDYDGWLEVGFVLYNAFNGNETGFELWREWSKKGNGNTASICAEKWETFSSEREDGETLGIGSLVTWAKEDSADFRQLWVERTAVKREQNRRNAFAVRESGVYYIGKNNEGELQETRICSRLEITAASRDNLSDSWGRLLEFEDLDGNRKQWLMPMNLLAGDGGEYRARLLSQGLQIDSSRKGKELLATYIQTASPQARVRSVSKIGWYKQAFVLPDKTFGESTDERVLYQVENTPEHRFNTSGTLHEWKDNIARYCVGNSRLMFAASAAFAGCLLPLTAEQGGGFHFRGASSLGKTTALLIAGSIWGGGDTKNGFTQTWRTTSNGLESIAELHNHGLLCLDEINQCEPKTVGETAYMLANGQGKARMNKSINARKRLEWNLMFLSSGEQSLADMISHGGERLRGGHQVRMCDLDADAGKGLGLFENLHQFTGADELANHLRRASVSYYGTPIRAFLDSLVSQQNNVCETWRNYRDNFFTQAIGGGQVSGEVQRVCSRFALVGFAGEIATKIGVTGWGSQTSTASAQEMFWIWLAGRGTSGASDAENAVRQVTAFLEAHGASRFQTILPTANSSEVISADELRVINRVGFKRQIESAKETEYLILPEAFKNEVCKGFDARLTAKELIARGMLRRQDDKNLTVVERLPELGQKRVYAIRLSNDA